MNTSLIIEIWGMIGAFLILLSFVFSGEKKLRIVNLAGVVVLFFYATIIDAYAIMVTEAACFFIHIYKLKELI